MANQPNILYFVADQMRADTHHYLGNPATITPNLDALVEEGVGFENAYCQNPVCVPSRRSCLDYILIQQDIEQCISFRKKMNQISCAL